jgi:hypothetical protein
MRVVGEGGESGRGTRSGRCASVRGERETAMRSCRGGVSCRGGAARRGGAPCRGDARRGGARRAEAAATTEEERREAVIWGKRLSADLEGDGS